MRGNGLKLFAFFLILLFTFFFSSCETKDGETPLDEKLGICFYGSPPSSYNCNNESRFEVNLDPWNDTSLTQGFLRIWFELWQGDDTKYESNDMYLALGSDSNYTLEFGGEIEGGYYTIKGGLAYYPPEGGDCLAAVSTKDSYSIIATPRDWYSKTMHIEYDYQYSYGLGSTTFEKLTSAFHVADTDTDFLRDEEDLPIEIIQRIQLGQYHFDHWSNTSPYNMHLLAVKGLEENQGQPVITTGESYPGPDGWSYVFVGDILDFHNDICVIRKTAVHELGHQRANLTHASGEYAQPQNHDSPFCVMNQDIVYDANNDDDPYNDPPEVLKRWFEINPHFCDKCVNIIKSVSW